MTESNNMKITGWTHWQNDYKDIFDLVETFTEEFKYKIYNLVAQELKKNGYKFTGTQHQKCATGCPIIDNKYTLRCSMRGWGKIMKLAYNIPDEDGLGYCAWAWSVPEGEIPVLPQQVDSGKLPDENNN